jgi:hypothetical protein
MRDDNNRTGNGKDEEQMRGSFAVLRMTTKKKQDAKAKTNTEILSFGQNDDGLLGEEAKTTATADHCGMTTRGQATAKTKSKCGGPSLRSG